MPTKFKKDGLEYRGSRAQRVAVKKKYFISQTPKQELIDYINSPSGKPKIKQKCRNELTRRGVRLIWKDKEAL
tara:strand:- start:1041 stop:1259 length:219 start_codon:yes stop_codon:yes gene_type:complete